MPRLKIILQSKLFLTLSIIFLILYVLLFTKIIKYESLISSNEREFTGIIIDYNIDGDKLSVLLKSKEKLQCTYYFKNESEKKFYIKNIKLGLNINVSGELSEPSNNTIPNTFNYKKYLYNKKIYWTFQINHLEIDSKTPSLIYKIKNYFVKKVNKYESISPYMHAFILGDNSYLDSDLTNTYRTNGITHLFAVSGMHISFLVASLSWLLSKLKLKENKTNIVVILFLIFYMFLIGFGASVVRASLLYIFLTLNKKLKLNLNSITVLYLIFLLLVLINPFYIYDLGFIYSFLTSFGLMLMSKKITGNYFSKLFKVSMIAFIFSLPVTLYNFYEFNLLTVINNIIIVPLVSIILFPLSLITFILPFFENILVIGFKILEWLNIICSNISVNIVIPKINFFFIIIYYFLVFLIYKRGFRYIPFIIILLLTFKLLPLLDNKAYIYYLDVGQGDSSLIISEHQSEIIMIDTGGKIDYSKEPWQIRNKNFNLASNIITFLHSLGISRLDILIITHGDADHIGYAKDIMEKIKIRNVMLNNNKLNSNEEKILSKIKNKVTNNYQTKNIQIYNLNNLVDKDENNSSLVLYFHLLNKNFLFMGDAPKEVEKTILNKYKLDIDILKLGHHGSNTSSDYEFLKKVNPKISIISAGRNNKYNHPSKETIENLENLNLKYFSTQKYGTIKAIIKNSKINLKFHKPFAISFP